MAEAAAPKLRILSWNVNGLANVAKGNMKALLDSLDADIICFQETKLSRDNIDISLAVVEGYNAYFSYCRKEQGHFGVVTYCKDTARPEKAEEGMSGLLLPHDEKTELGYYGKIRTEYPNKLFLRNVDGEGRIVATGHLVEIDDKLEYVAVLNVLCPRVDPDDPDSSQYKLDFYSMLEVRTLSLLEAGYYVVIAGDFDIAYRSIDNYELDDSLAFYEDPSRLWMSKFCSFQVLVSGEVPDGRPNMKMIDTFRWVYPLVEKVYTYWPTAAARDNNNGFRTDYILVDRSMITFIHDAEVLTDIEGSDHCPVKVWLNFQVELSSKPLPKLCTLYYPENSNFRRKVGEFLKSKPSLPSYFPLCAQINYGSFERNVRHASLLVADLPDRETHRRFGKLNEPSTSSASRQPNILDDDDDTCSSLDSATENDDIVSEIPSLECLKNFDKQERKNNDKGEAKASEVKKIGMAASEIKQCISKFETVQVLDGKVGEEESQSFAAANDCANKTAVTAVTALIKSDNLGPSESCRETVVDTEVPTLSQTNLEPSSYIDLDKKELSTCNARENSVPDTALYLTKPELSSNPVTQDVLCTDQESTSESVEKEKAGLNSDPRSSTSLASERRVTRSMAKKEESRVQPATKKRRGNRKGNNSGKKRNANKSKK